METGGRGGGGDELRERSGVWKRIVAISSLTAFMPLAAAVLSPLTYFAYNGLVFGGLVPVSGAVKQMWCRYLWDLQGGYNFVRSIRETARLEAFDGELLMAFEICAYLALMAWLGRHRRSTEDWYAAMFLLGALGLAMGHLATFGHSVLYLHPVHAEWPWYFVPARLMAALMIPLRCYVAVWLVRRTLALQSPRLARNLVLGAIMLGVSIQFATSSSAHRIASELPKTPLGSVARIAKKGLGEYLQQNLTVQKVMNSQKRTQRNGLSRRQHNYVGVQVMNRVLPEQSVVGAWNAGLLGYFAKFPVMNLDGLVNSYEFLDDLKAIPSGSGFPLNFLNYYEIFSKYGVIYFADNWIPSDPDEYLLEGSELLFEGVKYGRNRSFKIVSIGADQKIRPLHGSWPDFWKRMESRWDYQTDAVALFVEGRIVQAFAKDCTPEDLSEDRFVFSWRSENSEEASASWQPWIDASKNSLGFCAAIYVLPQEVIGPIRIQTARASTVPELDPKPDEP